MNVTRIFVLVSLFYTKYVCAEPVEWYCSYDEVAAALSNKQWDRSKFNQQDTRVSTNDTLEAAKVALYEFVGQSVKAQSAEYLDEIDISVNKLKSVLSDSKSKKLTFSDDHFEKSIELYLMLLGDFAHTHNDVINWQVLRDAILKSGSSQVTKTKCSHFEQVFSFRSDGESGNIEGSNISFLGFTVVVMVFGVLVTEWLPRLYESFP